MKQLICEMCSSNDIVKKDGMYVCQSCGTKYTVEEARKQMVEVEGTVDVSGSTVKVDTSDRLNNLKQLVDIEVKKEDCGNALSYLEEIIVAEPDYWKAHFFITYIKSWKCTKAEICSSARRFVENYETVFEKIKNNVPDSEQVQAVQTVYEKSVKLHDMLHQCNLNMLEDAFNGIISDSIQKQDKEFEDKQKYKYRPSRPMTSLFDGVIELAENANRKTEYINEFLTKAEPISSILSELGNEIEKSFSDKPEVMTFAVNAWNQYYDLILKFITLSKQGSSFKPKKEIYYLKLKEYDTEFAENNIIPGVNKENIGKVDDALRKNKKIDAIKIVREISGMGLEDAKKAVEDYAQSQGIASMTPLGNTKKKAKNIWLLYLLIAAISFGVFLFASEALFDGAVIVIIVSIISTGVFLLLSIYKLVTKKYD